MTDNQNAAAPDVSAAVKTHELKEKFRARSIPLEKDFHDLIDMADAGRLAAGLSPDQETTKATTGLTIGADQRLAVKVKTNSGLDVATDGVSVKKGNGIDTSADGVSVKVKKKGGLSVNPDGIGIDLNEPLTLNAEGKLTVGDCFVTKSGSSTVTGGDISFHDDGHGISFFGGGKIIKVVGGGVRWFTDDGGSRPSLSDATGTVVSPIATEQYVVSATATLATQAYVNDALIRVAQAIELVCTFADDINAEERSLVRAQLLALNVPYTTYS